MKYLTALLMCAALQGCTVLAIADVAASTVVYGVKTAVNVVDAITPDIVNKKKDK
jgi:ABC-type Fe3+-siderophore transport system permease subunit